MYTCIYVDPPGVCPCMLFGICVISKQSSGGNKSSSLFHIPHTLCALILPCRTSLALILDGILTGYVCTYVCRVHPYMLFIKVYIGELRIMYVAFKNVLTCFWHFYKTDQEVPEPEKENQAFFMKGD